MTKREAITPKKHLLNKLYLLGNYNQTKKSKSIKTFLSLIKKIKLINDYEI